MTVAVVTDSAADLPGTLADSLGIGVVPLSVAFGDETFLDGRDLSAEAFWDRVAEPGSPVPTTSSPPPEAFAAAYRSAADAGATGVVSVHLSGALSRTLESARAAAATAALPVRVIDSEAVSLGEGLVAMAAARAAAGGVTLEDVAAVAAAAPARLRLFAMLDGVEWLRRGGRLGAARAALSGLMHIRPVLTLAGGAPALVAKGRTRGRAIADVLERSAGPADLAGVIHSGAPEAADVTGSVRASSGVEPLTVLVGAVIGAHLGPKAVGVAILSPEGARDGPGTGDPSEAAE